MLINNNASLWRNRNFVIVWAGQSLSMFGSRLTYIALFWWVLEKTGSATALAGVAIATALPTFFFGPIAGAFVDRLDRRRLMLAMNLLFMLLLFALINFLLASTSVLFPIMAKDVLYIGAQGFGLFGSALSVGIVVGGLLTARLKRFRRHGLGIICGLVLLGLMLAVFGLSRSISLSLVALALVGLGVAIVNTLEAVIFQTRVPNELQGRVFGAQSAITDGLQPISLAFTGVVLIVFSAPRSSSGAELRLHSPVWRHLQTGE